jgi:cell division septation protein DedD
VRVAVALPPRPSAPPPKPIAAAPAPVGAGGKFAVQIAAVPTMEQVEQAWTAAASKPPIRGRTRRVQSVEVGGRPVYRLMVAGFADKGAATSFCVELKQGGRDCLVRAE